MSYHCVICHRINQPCGLCYYCCRECQECVQLMLVCNRFKLPKDVRLYLVKHLSKLYDTPANANAILVRKKTTTWMITVSDVSSTSKIFVNFFNHSNGTAILPVDLKSSASWKIKEATKKDKPTKQFKQVKVRAQASYAF